MPPVELLWAGKELLLDGDGLGGYEWISRADPRATEIRNLRELDIVGDRTDGAPNLLIRGDALHALRTLNQRHDYSELVGGVRVVYVDPPFNTGQGYGQYGDALERSMWLSMFRDRLEEVRPLLAPNASIWIHLDDSETHRARCVLDELFGERAFVSTIVWQKRTTRDSRAAFSSSHDYIHVYAPAGPKAWKATRNFLTPEARPVSNRDEDPRGPWTDAPFTAPGFRANQQYEIVTPLGTRRRPPAGRSWYATRDVYDALIRDNRIWFPSAGSGSPRLKKFLVEKPGLVPLSIWHPREAGSNDDATRHLMTLFPGTPPFATPKPERLLRQIVSIASSPGEVILDFFAGSATTAAVAHKMRRRWVAIEVSDSVFSTYALPRMKAVVDGTDTGGISRLEHWSGGGGFRVLGVAESSGTHQEVAAGRVVATA